MAKNYVNALKGKRVTSKTAVNLKGSDFKGLDRSEVARIVSTLASSANKRIKRLEQAGQPISDTVKPFSVAGKSRNELMKEFRRVRQFMTAENQSLRGQAKIARDTFKGIAKEKTGYKSGKKFNKAYETYKNTLGTDTREGTPYWNFWKAYDRLAETNKYVTDKSVKYKVLQKQVNMMKRNPGMDIDEIHARMTEIAEKVYKETKDQMKQDIEGDVFELKSK